MRRSPLYKNRFIIPQSGAGGKGFCKRRERSARKGSDFALNKYGIRMIFFHARQEKACPAQKEKRGSGDGAQIGNRNRWFCPNAHKGFGLDPASDRGAA